MKKSKVKLSQKPPNVNNQSDITEISNTHMSQMAIN